MARCQIDKDWSYDLETSAVMRHHPDGSVHHSNHSNWDPFYHEGIPDYVEHDICGSCNLIAPLETTRKISFIYETTTRNDVS